jgi:hypothetical protein
MFVLMKEMIPAPKKKTTKSWNLFHEEHSLFLSFNHLLGPGPLIITNLQHLLSFLCAAGDYMVLDEMMKKERVKMNSCKRET